MDILKRALAPITDLAWTEIEAVTASALRTHMIGRRIVDVSGPHGWDFAAIGLGRLDVDRQSLDEVYFGVHQVQPLVEVRVPFSLGIWELDNVTRGAADVDLTAAIDAAKRIADFEDGAIFNGFEKAKIQGLLHASPHPAIAVRPDSGSLLEGVSKALLALLDAAVQGPYVLVLGPRLFQTLANTASGYPLRKQVEQLLEGKAIYRSVIEGGALVSKRGGDLELTIGQDISLGYESHDTKQVRLYLTESFTFRILDPSVAVPLTLASS
ncbi:MAG: family 1 encapsulin nanocompartment shell protein [Candidatus Eisenbacteria bacterium]|nr:family 1 encapsulin nanocompartment shell protein [Candidatus Eisenbacteria bacterium]